MAAEIERKFLLIDDSWRDEICSQMYIAQGYLANTERGSVRVRIAGERAFLNIKSMTFGISRTEYEYEIPLTDARKILAELCMQPLIEKTRYLVQIGVHTWEIDEFSGDNAGLIVAEIELQNTDELFDKPAWLGKEVSDDPRYLNVCLVAKPYKDWS